MKEDDIEAMVARYAKAQLPPPAPAPTTADPIEIDPAKILNSNDASEIIRVLPRLPR